MMDRSRHQVWYKKHLALLSVCEMHGKTAQQHHNQLVEKYIAVPANPMNQEHMDKLTSGPPQRIIGSARKVKRPYKCQADA